MFAALHGCGYSVVRAPQTCHVGLIEDRTTEGDLGRIARRHLQNYFERGTDSCSVTGSLSLASELPIASDSLGASVYRLEITLKLIRDSSLWRAEGQAIYLRGANLATTRLARRAAFEEAVDKACAEIVKDIEF